MMDHGHSIPTRRVAERCSFGLMALSVLADLVGVMLGSQAPLLQLLAGELARVQERKGAQTVGSRFRDQLRDLLQRLDE